MNGAQMKAGKFPTRIAASAALAAALALSGCSHHAAAGGDDSADSANAKAEVTLTRVVRTDISQTITLTGNAAALPNQDVRVSSLVAGRVADLKVAEGDRVSAGQLLAKIDDRTYRDQLNQADAAEAQTKATLENARLSDARNQDLFKRGIVARKDLEDAETQLHVSEAAESQTKAALEIARRQVERTEILSPLNGMVAKRFVSVGEQVDGTAAQPIVEVASLGEIEFLANAPPAALAKIRAGESVRVTSEALPGKSFPGRVVAVSPSVDPATGVGLVRVRVPNSAGQLRLGLFLTAEIPVETHAHALCVPPDSIYRDDAGEPRVYEVNQDTAKAVPVELGIQTKDLVELKSGVKEGDSVILKGGYGLADTAKIQTVPSKPDSDSAPGPEPNSKDDSKDAPKDKDDK
jgi:RND family efflux transporter MFP subunit